MYLKKNDVWRRTKSIKPTVKTAAIEFNVGVLFSGVLQDIIREYYKITCENHRDYPVGFNWVVTDAMQFYREKRDCVWVYGDNKSIISSPYRDKDDMKWAIDYIKKFSKVMVIYKFTWENDKVTMQELSLEEGTRLALEDCR